MMVRNEMKFMGKSLIAVKYAFNIITENFEKK